MKKVSKSAKTLLFAMVLLVTAIGLTPSTGEAYEWTLTCSGPADYCGTVTDYNMGISVSVYGWAFESFSFQFDV